MFAFILALALAIAAIVSQKARTLLGWLAALLATLMIVVGLSVGSYVGAALSAIALLLACPPIWKTLNEKGHKTYAAGRWSAAIIVGFIGMAVNANTHSQTPEGKAAAERRLVAKEEENQRIAAQEKAKDDAEEARLASGEHCLSSWDGSLPPLKDAVKSSLRNPRSFEHVETVRSPVNDKGVFALIMTYRAENGFGGMNVERMGGEVNARTCDFKQASLTALAKHLRR